MAHKKDSFEEDVSIISSGVRIEGSFFSEGNVRIDGNIKGDVIVNGNLTTGDLSLLTGEVKAKNVTMSGKIVGRVHASEKLKLEPRSILKGDLFTKILVIEEGALFEGNSQMNLDSASASTE